MDHGAAHPVITVFRSRLRPDAEANGYGELASRMEARARTMAGFVDFKCFTAADGERVSIIAFDTFEHQCAWREDPEHCAAQSRGRQAFYAEFSISVCDERHHRTFRSVPASAPEVPDGAEEAIGGPILTRRYDDALAYASLRHRDQLRKGTQIPYLAHLLAVSSLVLESGGGEDEAIAGLLHDAIEDQGGMHTEAEIRRNFGDHVADIVLGCSDTMEVPKPPWCERKESYLAGLPTQPPSVLLVSLADKVHNARSMLADYLAVGDELWKRFSADMNDQFWYYASLAKVYREQMGEVPLVVELERLIHELRSRAKG